MAAFIQNSIWLSTLALGAALALAPPALAADVTVQLDAGAGFSIKNSTGAIERMRVDEATGNLSRNGALFIHTTGGYNTFVGPNAGNTSTTGYDNSAFGRNALSSNTTGNSNSAFGERALASNTASNYNSAFGSRALYANTAGGNKNSAFGHAALSYNITGDENSAVGHFALRRNTTASKNSAFGFESLHLNQTGENNSAFGHRALRNSQVGGNSAFGRDALASLTTSGNNSAFGENALASLIFSSSGASAFGQGALQNSTSGGTAFGYKAMNSTTTNAGNGTAVGWWALRYQTTGASNTAVGFRAMSNNISGSDNSAFGSSALWQSTTGSENVAIGKEALGQNLGGSRNIAIGLRAGHTQNLNGSDNIYIGHQGGGPTTGTIYIGIQGTQTQTTIAGIRGITTGLANAIPVLIDSTGQLGTVSSSRSVKQEIHDMGDATDRLLALRPVMFRYRQEQTLPSGEVPPPEYGLIAEEVAEVFPDLVVYDEAGQPFTVKYHVMAPMLLNEVQKQQRTIEGQQQVIAELSSRLTLLEGKAKAAAAFKGAIR